VAVIAVWLDQAIFLWPLPSEVAVQSAVASDPNAAAAWAWWESQLWRAWFMRIVAIPLGVFSGVLLLKNHVKWPIVLLATSVASFVLFRTWQWLPLLALMLTSKDRAFGRGWVLEHPQLIMNGLVFPVVLVVAAACGGVAIARHRRESPSLAKPSA